MYQLAQVSYWQETSEVSDYWNFKNQQSRLKFA